METESNRKKKSKQINGKEIQSSHGVQQPNEKGKQVEKSQPEDTHVENVEHINEGETQSSHKRKHLNGKEKEVHESQLEATPVEQTRTLEKYQVKKKVNDYGVVDSLGDDLLVEILSKLPVKSLLRCCSVSKRWYALTKTASFITRHKLPSHHHHPCMILQTNGYKSDHHKFGFLLVSDVEETISSSRLPVLPSLKKEKKKAGVRGEEKTIISNMRLPVLSFVKEIKEIRVIGSSNGLVYLNMRCQIHRNGEERVYKQVIVVWNPATEKYRILPKPNTKNTNIPFSEDEEDDIIRVNYSNDPSLVPLIGLDFVDDEYKVARIFCHDDDDPAKGRVYGGKVFRAQVFVPSTNSWRAAKNELGFESRQQSYPSTSIMLNGVLYWKVKREPGAAGERRDCCVMSFDLREEVFNVIELPIYLRRQFWNDLRLYSWQNSVAYFTLYYQKLWVMNSNKKTPVWTLQFTFGYDVLQNASECLGFWKDDQFMIARKLTTGDYALLRDLDPDADYLFHPNVLFSYNPKTHTHKYIIIQRKGIKISHGVLNYVPTLAPV